MFKLDELGQRIASQNYGMQADVTEVRLPKDAVIALLQVARVALATHWEGDTVENANAMVRALQPFLSPSAAR